VRTAPRPVAMRTHRQYVLRQAFQRFMQKENRVRSTQTSLENVNGEPGSAFTFRRRWSNRRNFPCHRKRQS
jgi:hypothetical protein